MKKCRYCEKPIDEKRAKRKTTIFCSNRCSQKHHKRRYRIKSKIPCQQCKKPFNPGVKKNTHCLECRKQIENRSKTLKRRLQTQIIMALTRKPERRPEAVRIEKRHYLEW